jgi:hypothetical protein
MAPGRRKIRALQNFPSLAPFIERWIRILLTHIAPGEKAGYSY